MKPIELSTPQDAEYQSIRAIFDARGTQAGQLPGKPVYFLPESSGRAEAIIALDKRIQSAKRYLPWIIGAASMLVSFLAGLSISALP